MTSVVAHPLKGLRSSLASRHAGVPSAPTPPAAAGLRRWPSALAVAAAVLLLLLLAAVLLVATPLPLDGPLPSPVPQAPATPPLG